MKTKIYKNSRNEYFNKNLSNIVLAEVLVDKNSPFLKSIIINKGTRPVFLKVCQLQKIITW